jgi:translocator protein
MKTSIRPFAVVTSYIVLLVFNALANIIPFNGLTTGEISNRFPVYFVPAGYIFAIWGIIYILLGAYVTYQALPKQRENKMLDKVGWLFVISCIANILWLLLWHYLFISITIFFMIILLITLIKIYTTAKIGENPKNRKQIEKLFIELPFSVYLGWISVATISNVTVVLYNLGIKGFIFSDQVWAGILILTAGLLALLFLLKRMDISYALVIIWAIFGIYDKFSSTPVIVACSFIALLLIMPTAIYQIVKKDYFL